MNTLILAAGLPDHRNIAQGLTGSKLLTMINGRPIIAWVVRDALKFTGDFITLVINAQDHEMIEYCERRYSMNNRVNICMVKDSLSIPHSLLQGIDSLGELKQHNVLRVNFGDTLIMQNCWDDLDSLYVSNFSYSSESWCVIANDDSNSIPHFYNKQKGLLSPDYKALVGRTIFSNSLLLKQAVKAVVSEINKPEFSDVLDAYAKSQALTPHEIQENTWVDFGHLEGFAKARSQLIESRCFNQLSLHPILPEINKASENQKKLEQELYWYQNLPLSLQAVCPRVLEYNANAIRMEYYGYGTLAEKLIYSTLSDSFWEAVLNKLFNLVSLFCENTPKQISADIDAKVIYKDKTLKRITQLKQQSDSWVELLSEDAIKVNNTQYHGLPKLLDHIDQRIDKLLANTEPSIIHGDLCFNNILFDVASGVIKLIDPRGEFGGGQQTIYGDKRYDIAKLRHSFCGCYDHIIEGDFHLSVLSPNTFNFTIFSEKQGARSELFDKICEKHGYNIDDIRFIEALLFLSMLPLHSESIHKQTAFFITAIQKLNEYFQGELK